MLVVRDQVTKDRPLKSDPDNDEEAA